MRWPFSLPRRSQEPTLASGEPDRPASPAGEQPDWVGPALEPLARTLGSAPLTVRPNHFIAGLAVSHGLTPTLRTLEHESASGGPAGIIGGLAVPAVAPAGALAARAGGSRAGQTGRHGGRTGPVAKGQTTGDSVASSLGEATEVVVGLKRRLPAVDPAGAERAHSYASVDPASDPSPSSSHMQSTGAGPGGDAAANQAAVHGQPGSPIESFDKAGGAAVFRASSGVEAARGVAGPSSAEGQSHLSPGRVRRVGLGAPLAGLPVSAEPHGLAASQSVRGAGPESARGSGTLAAAVAAAATVSRRSPITGGATRPLPVLPAVPLAPSGAAGSAGHENRMTSFAAVGPSRSLPGAARPGAESGPSVAGTGGATRSISVQRAAIGRDPNGVAHSPGASSSGAGQAYAQPVWSAGSRAAETAQPQAAGARQSELPLAAGARQSELPLAAGAWQSELPLAAPPSPPASSLPTGSADAAAGTVIQRIHTPDPAQPDATPGDGSLVVARAPATGSSAGSQGVASGSGVQSIPDDQVEQLAGRVYGRIRDRLGAELLRDRERAGLLPDR